MEQHRNLWAEKIGQENNRLRQYHKAETLNRICQDDSALHSVSLPETDDIQQEKGPQWNIIGNRY